MDPSRERFRAVGVPAGAVLLGVVTLIVVGAIVALTVGRGGSGGDASRPPQSAGDRFPPPVAAGSEPTVAAPIPPEAPDPSVTAQAVRWVIRAYVRSYDAEDARAAGATMSPGVVRRSGATSVQHGRQAAMTEYQRQFDRLAAPRYALHLLSIAPGAGEARAQGRYAITSKRASRSTGSITFHLVAVGDRLLIDRITATPD